MIKKITGSLKTNVKKLENIHQYRLVVNQDLDKEKCRVRGDWFEKNNKMKFKNKVLQTSSKHAISKEYRSQHEIARG